MMMIMITIDAIDTGSLTIGTLDALALVIMVMMMMVMMIMLITRCREARPAMLWRGSEGAALDDRIRKTLAGVGHGW